MQWWWDKVVDFFKNCDATDLVMLGSLILIPVLAVILLIVSIAKASKRRKAAAEEPEEVVVEQAASADAEPLPQPRVAYQPQPVKPVERVKVKVRVTNLKKADKYLLMATGVFCLGLGAMIQRAMSRD